MHLPIIGCFIVLNYKAEGPDFRVDVVMKPDIVLAALMFYSVCPSLVERGSLSPPWFTHQGGLIPVGLDQMQGKGICPVQHVGDHKDSLAATFQSQNASTDQQV